MEGIHLLGEWYGCPPDTPEFTRADALRDLCVNAARRAGLTVTDNTAKAEQVFNELQAALRPARKRFQAIHRGGRDA